MGCELRWIERVTRQPSGGFQKNVESSYTLEKCILLNKSVVNTMPCFWAWHYSRSVSNKSLRGGVMEEFDVWFGVNCFVFCASLRDETNAHLCLNAEIKSGHIYSWLLNQEKVNLFVTLFSSMRLFCCVMYTLQYSTRIWCEPLRVASRWRYYKDDFL